MRGITVASNGDLLRDGVRFRNVGCNYRYGINLSWGQTLPAGYRPTPSADQDAAIAWFQSVGVKVIRVQLFPTYPNQWTAAVLNGKAWNVANAGERAAFYAAYVDPLIAKCRAADITVLLNLFTRHATVSDLTGGIVRDWLSSTNTRTFAQTLTQEIVTRYLTESAVGGYIFSNELNHYTNSDATWLVPNTSYGTQASYSAANSTFNQQEYRDLLSWWYGVARAIDSQRILLSGNGATRYFLPGPVGSIPNPILDYFRDVELDNPMNAGQIHWYNNIGYCSPNDKGLSGVLAGARHWMAKNGKGFVLGEWGDQAGTLSAMSAVGSTVTMTSLAAKGGLLCEPGDSVVILGAGGGWDGEYKLDTLSANRQTATATKSGAPGSPYSGTSARVMYQATRFQNNLDAIYTSGVDVSLLWNYDTDALYPRSESCDPFGPNSWQGPLIAAANRRLGWVF